jgi:hypothetical protein
LNGGSDGRPGDYNLCSACLKNGSSRQAMNAHVAKSGAIAKYASHFSNRQMLKPKGLFVSNPKALGQILRIERVRSREAQTSDNAGRLVWHVLC